MKSSVIELSQATDQRSAILQKVGDLSGHQLLGDRVLVATYIEPEKTAGGIIMPQARVEESRFQGKVGLVLAIGPTAFRYEGGYEWEGPKPVAGDWVMYFPSNAREFFLGGSKDRGGVSCRQISADLIEAIVANPNSIY